MNLQNNKITLGELLDTPQSRAVIQKKLPMVLKHPMVGASRTITLEQMISAAQAFLSQKKIDDMLEELRKA